MSSIDDAIAYKSQEAHLLQEEESEEGQDDFRQRNEDIGFISNDDMRETAHKYNSPTKRQQRHCFYCSAIGILVLPILYFAASLSALWHHTPRVDPEPGFATRCSKFPADCEITAPFIFDSVYSLAKQWPNTYGPNGHSIVPAKYPRNMPLYHAKQWEGDLKKRTWFAFDAEMSVGIYGGTGTTFLHAVLPSRELSLLYFDGESATLTTSGSLDSQTALLREHIEPDPDVNFTYNETARGEELCALAKELGVDGYMRMNAGFEVLACDITASGIREIYRSNITVPGDYVRENPALPQDPNREPPLGIGNTFVTEYAWDWIRSAAWHYGSFGNGAGTHRETRVKLDLCGMITYYDPSLRSLSGKHTSGVKGGEHYQNGWGLRRGHRLLGISDKDSGVVKSWVKSVLQLQHGPSFFGRLRNIFKEPLRCSNNNWQAVTETIMDSHRSRAIEVADVLDQNQAGTLSIAATMDRIHLLSHAVLTPYFEYPHGQGESFPLSASKEQTISRCSNTFTSYLNDGSMNDFEGVLKDSIYIVVSKLCRWEWDLFEWSENHTTNIFQNPARAPNVPVEKATAAQIEKYSEETDRILKWLGWSTWTDCPTKCAIGEICYIPMWPVIYSNGTRQGSIYAGSKLTKEEEEYFWSPKCLSREMHQKAGGRGRDPENQMPDPASNPRIDPDH